MTEKTEIRRPKPGRYVGQLLDYGVSKTKNDDLQIFAVFSFKDSTEENFIQTWFGTLKPGKGQDITKKALVTMGWDQNRGLSDIGAGVDSELLNLDKRVVLTVNDEQDQQGNLRSRINWINDLGGVPNRVHADEAKEILGRMIGFWSDSGTGSSYGAPSGQFAPPPSDSEVPF